MLPLQLQDCCGNFQQLSEATGSGNRGAALGKRYVDDSKVSDHHAIIPTAVSPEKAQLSEEESKIYDLVCRRLLMMWHDDHLQAVTTVITAITTWRRSWTAIEPREPSCGRWVGRFSTSERKGEGERRKAVPRRRLRIRSAGQRSPKDSSRTSSDIEAQKKKTRPPKRFTEGTILTAMQTAGKSLDEKELSDAMKETGLGTPATRAAIIEVLLKRGYIVRTGKSLEATEKGIHLIEVVHPEVKSPAMTGQWEAFLKRIQHGECQLEPFLDRISQYVRSVVGRVSQTTPVQPAAAVPTPHRKSPILPIFQAQKHSQQRQPHRAS